MKRVNPDKLCISIAQIYKSLGVRDEHAELLADTLVLADLWGHSSHGVMRAAWYGNRLKNMVTDARALPEVLVDTGPLLAIDGYNGIGQVIIHEAVSLVSARAKKYGICCASISRSGHFGMAMYFTKILADKNMIGFLATNASPSMAPFGGTEKLIGNNPQSWSAPTGQSAPFILDIAHTTVARGKIYLAKEKNEPIPDHWALTRNGSPTTDPEEAILGTLLPMAGHKGYGLSAIMDVLSGILSSSNFGPAINGPYVPNKLSGVGHFLFAIDIAQLRDIGEFTTDMQAMIGTWKSSQRQEGVSEIFYPGEKEHRNYLACLKKGLMLPEEIITSLEIFAESCGVKISAIYF